MQNIPDETKVGTLNLPGSHDSVAIRMGYPLGATAYGCQDLTLTGQLNAGIRLLDIRVKAIWDYANKSVFLAGCHSDIYIPYIAPGLNQYGPLSDYAVEIRAWLAAHPREIVVVVIKIDDETLVPDANRVSEYQALEVIFPSIPDTDAVPTVGDVRKVGQLYPLYRIGNTHGAHLHPLVGWQDNTQGEYRAPTPTCLFSTYAQDAVTNWQGSDPEAAKLALVNRASRPGSNQNADVVFNFGSAIFFIMFGVRINRKFLDFYGSLAVANRNALPPRWCFFDYPEQRFTARNAAGGDRFTVSVIDIIIDANFNYAEYGEMFITDPNLP
jgi:hypothetical protein